MKRFMILMLALVALVASPVSAQWGLCPGDDGLSIPGTCCIPAFPGLPALPGIQMPVSACTWNNCTPVATWTNTVLVSPPFQVFSDLWVGNLTIVAGPQYFAVFNHDVSTSVTHGAAISDQLTTLTGEVTPASLQTITADAPSGASAPLDQQKLHWHFPLQPEMREFLQSEEPR